MTRVSKLHAAACAALSGIALPVVVHAQQQLPGIVVQGAQLQATPPKRSIERDEDDATPAPSTKPPAKSKGTPRVARQPSSGSAPQTAPAAVTPAAPDAYGIPAADRDEAVAGIAADRTGSAVTVVTGSELRQRQIRNGADALRSLPGVSVSRTGSLGGDTVVRLRGAESNQTQVLIDGMEVNAPGGDGVFDFANLAVEDIERIEVLRGPQSGLFGSGALAGAINIVTKSGRGPLTIQARSEIGSFRTREAAVSISGGTDKAHGILTLYGRRADGFNIALAGDEADAHQLSNLSFAGGFKVFDNLKIDGTLRRSGLRLERDGFDANGRFFGAVDDLSTSSSDVWLGRVAATLDTFSDGRWVQRLSGGQVATTIKDFDRGPFAIDPVGGDLSQTTSKTTKYGYTSTYRLDFPGAARVRHYVTGQIERQEESFEQPTNLAAAFQGKRERATNGYVGEVRGEYFDTLFLSGVVRRDDNTAFDDFTTWRTSASLKVPATIFRLHGSIGTGVKYPSFSEQFGFFASFAPNPDLKPEQSLGWDAGVEMSFLGGRAVFDVTYFDQNLENEIDFRGGFDPVGNFVFQPFNRDGESTRRGIEVAARARLTPALSLGASYTYLLARETDEVTGARLEEVRRAPHSGRIDANYAFAAGRGNFNLAIGYNGRMLDTAFPSDFSDPVRVALKEYWLLTAAASYRVLPGVEVYGRVENLLDQRYQEIFSYDTAGIAAYGGVRFTFEDAATRDWARYK